MKKKYSELWKRKKKRFEDLKVLFFYKKETNR